MGKTVHTPCCIKGKGITECITDEKSIPDAFIPEIPRNHNWHDEIEKCTEELVMSGVEMRI